MNKFEEIMSKSIDELVDWIDENFAFDSAPYMRWYDDNYCKKCEAIRVHESKGYFNEYAWCELNGKCKFFQDMDEIPSPKQTIKMWLETEAS